MKIEVLFLRIMLGVLMLLFTSSVNTQSVMVTTMVPTTPPPITFQEILSFESKIIFQLTNLTTDRLQVKFGLTLTNERRGIHVALNEDFLPTLPFNLEAGESKTVRFRNLKAAYANLSESDIVLEGIDYESILRAERLPEGDYELCITVQDYFTNELLSFEGSCGYFPVLEYEPPIVIFPDHEQVVHPQTPQNILFQWTPTGDVAKTRYRIQLVNASDHGFENPLDVFNHENEVFIYELDGLRFTQQLYNQNHPMLVEGDTYTFRVQAYDFNNEFNYLNDGWSQPIAFQYRTTEIGGPGAFANGDGDNVNFITSNCVNYTDDISTTLNSNVQVGQMILINAFEMVTTQINFNATSQSYSREGIIAVPFLNTSIKVQFDNIKINSIGRVFGNESLIYGKVDNSSIVPLITAQDWESPVAVNFPNNYESHLASKSTGNGSTLDLPFKFSGSRATIAGFLLQPNQAKLKINLPLSLPEISGNNDPYISFSNSEVCINTDGFIQDNMSLLLSEDVNLPIINNNMKLRLPTDENEATITSNGNFTVNLSGDIQFEKSIVAYKNSNNKVRVPFSVENVQNLEMLIPVTEDVDNLIFPGLKDLRIAPEQIIVDLSNNSNGNNFNNTFPGNSSLWKGIFIKGGNVKLPKGLGGSNLQIDIKGLALTANGLSLKVKENETIVDLNTGKLASWPFSIKEFELTIDEGEITHGKMNGNLRLPIQNGGKIPYTSLLSSNNDDKLDLAMNMQPSDNIDVDMWLASINIYEASIINFSVINDKYQIEADINGSLRLDHNNSSLPGVIGHIDIPSLDFQHLKVKGIQGSDPTMNIGAVALEDPDGIQMSVQNFNFTLGNWNIRTEGNRHALNFSMGLSLFGGDLFDGGFGAGVSTELDIWAKYQNGFKFDETRLKEIEGKLDLGIAEAFIKINLFNSDPTFGNGFRGEAGITLARVSCAMEAGFVIQFGKVDGYRYWYFDGRYKNMSGIPLGNSGISLFGFGGGGYYNMKAIGPDKSESKRFNELVEPSPVSYTNPAVSISDFTYEPKKNNRGFRAMAVIGSTVSSKSWNVESNLLIDWEKGKGINNVVFEGDFNIMRDINSDGEPPIKLFDEVQAKLLINVSRELDDRRTFIANLDTKMSGRFVSASYPLSMMYSSLPNGKNKQWYIHFGSWSKSDPFSDNARVEMSKGPSSDFFTLQSKIMAYIMMGNTYHTGSILPPLPEKITGASSDSYGNGALYRDNEESAEMESLLDGDNESNFGIGFGIAFQMKFALNILIFYTDFSAEISTDLALTVAQQGCEGYPSVGFNGWFASGQAYAYIQGKVGVKGKLFRKNIEVKLLELKAGAALRVQFPTPKRAYGTVFIGGSILNGRIKIKTRKLEFEKGEKCIPTGDFDPLANLDYVNEVIPNTGKKKVSVFADPKIAFNIPNEEILTFQDIEEKTHTYKVNYTIRLKNLKDNQLVDISEIWSNNNQAFRIKPKDWLQSQTEYEIQIYIKAYELRGGTFKEFDEKTEKYTFKTGNRPDYIPAQDIVQSYPGLSQRYFMIAQDDGDPIKGFVQLDQVNCNDILKDVQFNDQRDGYWAVFTNLRTRKEKAVKCNCSSAKRIEWDMPQNISPEEIFRIELLARDFEGAFAAPSEELQEEWVGNSHFQANEIESPPLYEQQTFSFVNKETYTSHTKTKNLLDESIGWYAQRSKFRSYGEKLDRFSVHQVAYLPQNIGYDYTVREGVVNEQVHSNSLSKNFHVPFVLLRPNAMTEPFDQYDLVGYKSPVFGIGWIDPILNPNSDFNDYCFEFTEMVYEQLGTFDEANNSVNPLTSGANRWPRPSRYPYYNGPDEVMGIMPRFLRNYKKYERKLGNAGYNVNLWRPAPLVQQSEIESLTQGHQSDATGLGFTNGTNPTHSNSGTTGLQIYIPVGPTVGSTTFGTLENDDDRDIQGGSGTLFTNNSYLPLVDWTSLVVHKDRVHINRFAINKFGSIINGFERSLLFDGLLELDNRFRNLKIPNDQYKIKLMYKTGGFYDIHYQYSRS